MENKPINNNGRAPHKKQVQNNRSVNNTQNKPNHTRKPVASPSATGKPKSAPKPIKPTPEQVEIAKKKQQQAELERRRILREEAQKRAALRKERQEKMLAYIILVGIVFAIMAVIFSVVFFINLTYHKSPDTEAYSLILSDYDNQKLIEDGYVIGENDKRYVNFSQMADFYGFAMVGSIDSMKYIIKGDRSETVTFAVGSDRAMINDVLVRMGGKAKYIDGDLFVDKELIFSYINGFTVEEDARERTLSVNRILLNPVDAEGVIADGNPPSYESISFKLKAPIMSVSISEDDTAVTIPTFTFNADLSAYEEYMNPGSTTEFLTLVNEEHKLSEDYIPTGLSMLSVGDGMYLKDYAARSFAALYKEATACGITGLTVSEGYVSYDELIDNYNAIIEEYAPIMGAEQAKRMAKATVPTPGCDEHQTGLALDFALTNGADFNNSIAYVWLRDNSYKFGFIQRYANTDSAQTGNLNQFRYVGRYHAVRINALGLSFDDYVEYLGL